MSCIESNISPYPTSAFVAGVHSLGASIGNTLNATTQKIKCAVISPLGQGVIGFGLGVGSHQVYGPLTNKIVTILLRASKTHLRRLSLGSIISQDPFSNLSFGSTILLTPYICVIAPITEELLFRGRLQDQLNDTFKSLYVNQGLSDSTAHTTARITSIFFASVLFGLVHFTNAIFFWCNPILFLPQVVAATLMGLLFGVAKEFSGELHMPIGMHIGNNTFAWAYYYLT